MSAGQPQQQAAKTAARVLYAMEVFVSKLVSGDNFGARLKLRDGGDRVILLLFHLARVQHKPACAARRSIRV